MNFEKYKQNVLKKTELYIEKNIRHRNIIKVSYNKENFWCWYLYEKHDKLYVIVLNNLINSKYEVGDIMIIDKKKHGFNYMTE